MLIYRLLFLCVCVCVCVFRLFVRLPISPPRIKLAASNFARRFISVQGGESPIFVNFAPTETQNRTNRLARGPHTPLQYVAQSRIGIIDIGQSTLTFLLCLTFKMKKTFGLCPHDKILVYVNNKKLTYCKETARRAISVEILQTTARITKILI